MQRATGVIFTGRMDMIRAECGFDFRFGFGFQFRSGVVGGW
jgi:hypothetical protein